MAGGGVALYGADIYCAGTVDLLFDGTGSTYGVYKGKLQYHPPLHRAADAKVKTRKLLSWRARSRISELFPDIPKPLISIDGIVGGVPAKKLESTRHTNYVFRRQQSITDRLMRTM